MSGCPVGLVLGVMASGIVDTITKHLVATLAIYTSEVVDMAIYTSEVVDMMKKWLQVPDNPNNVRNICTFFPPFSFLVLFKKDSFY